MNVYDTANKLAEEIKESLEFQNFKRAKEEIEKAPELKGLLEEFEKIRYEIQIAAMQGKEPIDEKTEQMQKKYTQLIEKENMREYFDSEFKFNVLLGDVNKIISEAVRELLEK